MVLEKEQNSANHLGTGGIVLPVFHEEKLGI
jgi:hypothetical protein